MPKVAETKEEAKTDRQRYSDTLRHFDHLYANKGIHPGRPFVFYANMLNAHLTTYLNNPIYKVINTAYNKKGELIENHSVIFIQRSVAALAK